MSSDHQPLRGFTGPDTPDLVEADRCVRCGLCLPHCPTYRETLHETSSPRGRIHLIAAVGAGRLDLLSPGFVGQMQQCLNCRACEAVCPSGVKYGHLVEGARTQIARAQAATPAVRTSAAMLEGVFGDMRRFRAMVALLRIYQRRGGRAIARGGGILRAMGLAEQEALLPDLPTTFFIPADQRYEPDPAVPRQQAVAFFAGCVMSTMLAPTDRATIRVLSALGYPVVVPAGQGCCGALSAHSGQLTQARERARQTIAAFGDSATLIVNNAAGCGSSLKEYGHLLHADPDWAERAAAFSARVRDLTELIGSALTIEQRGSFHPIPLRVAYQDACHLAHAQGITQPPRVLLTAIPDLELVEMEDSALCCGSAGIYNLTQPVMAARLGTRKIATIRAAAVDLVVTANPGCFLQLRGGLRHKSGAAIGILHIADLLDAALRGLPVEAVMQMARQ